MRRRPANDPEDLDRSVGPDLFRVLLKAFGVALLLGLVSGVVWIAFNLVKLHLLP